MKSVAPVWRLASFDNSEDEQARRASKSNAREEDDLPYRVEIWNYTGTFVEQTLAITNSRSLGFAVYYAAIQEFSDSLITLRHKDIILVRYNASKH
jgi:hypothetical protein